MYFFTKANERIYNLVTKPLIYNFRFWLVSCFRSSIKSTKLASFQMDFLVQEESSRDQTPKAINT